jgi:hypothetical protein
MVQSSKERLGNDAADAWTARETGVSLLNDKWVRASLRVVSSLLAVDSRPRARGRSLTCQMD